MDKERVFLEKVHLYLFSVLTMTKTWPVQSSEVLKQTIEQ